MAAKRQLRLDPLLERDQAQLLQPICLRLRELLVGEVAVGPPPPEPERASQQRGRQRRVPLSRGGSALYEQPLEAGRVE